MDLVVAAEKEYVNVAEKRNINYPHIEKSLVIVRKFIQDRKRILYGGMAIDLNLKSAGQPGIYSEDTIPDYDIMSPDFFQDSMDLADILYKAGLPGISSINQLHVTGRRVRVNFVTVCDIGYVPQDVYDRIPRHEITNLPKYKGLWVVSPDFQRLDVHRAFCHPYENVPQETILHRFAKDQKRFRLLDEQFPLLIAPKGAKGAKEAKSESRLEPESTPAKKFHTSINMTWREMEGQAITGFLAYALLRRYLEHLLGKPQLPSVSAAKLTEAQKMFEKIPRHDVKITDTGVELEWNLPMRARLSLLSNDYEEFLQKNATGHTQRYYTRFLDGLRPRAVRYFAGGKGSSSDEVDSFETSSSIPSIVRKFQELEVAYPLKASRKLAELVKETKEANEALTAEPGVPPAELIEWCDSLRSMWTAILPDIEISNPISVSAKAMIESLPAAAELKIQKAVAPEIPEIEVLDCMGALVPVFQLRGAFQALGQMCQLPKELSTKIKNWPERLYIAQTQYHLMHFLQCAYERPQLAHVFREYYINMTNMIIIMETLGKELFSTALPKVSADAKAWSLYRTIPFYLGTETLGTLTRNYNLSYLAGVRERIMQVQSSLPNVLLSNSGGSKSLRPPFGYYPEREGPHQVFSVEGNPLFQTNGARCTKEMFDSLTMRILVPEVLRDPNASQVQKADSDED